jgi:hypothetical protein
LRYSNLNIAAPHVCPSFTTSRQIALAIGIDK